MTIKLPALFNRNTHGLSTESSDRFSIYSVFLLISWVMCLLVGKFENYTHILSAVMLICIMASFFDDTFYLYAALFIFFRYRMIVLGTPVFRFYTYLVVLKFMLDLPSYKLRPVYFPALLVFSFHCIFASANVNARLAFNVLVDFMIIYIIMMKVVADDNLMRRFLFVFLLGGIGSGVYGLTAAADEVSKSISIRGGGTQEVTRNVGSLGDANYAGMIYDMCILTAIFLKTIKPWLKIVILGAFVVFLLQTASLSALLTLLLLIVIAIIFKYRIKSVFIIGVVLVCVMAGVAFIMAVPSIRNIPALSGIILRFTEKARYLSQGRWDLLTTDRYAIWQQALNYYGNKTVAGKLIGGSIITVMILDTKLFAYAWACHNSYIQALLNFGLLGALLVYINIFAILLYRIACHFSKKENYENEDIKIIQIMFMFGFVIFGFTVDFFIDWSYLFFIFI